MGFETRSHNVAQATLELTTFLLQPLGYWNYMYAAIHGQYFAFKMGLYSLTEGGSGEVFRGHGMWEDGVGRSGTLAWAL